MSADIKTTFLSVAKSVVLMHGLSVIREIRCLLHLADVRSGILTAWAFEHWHAMIKIGFLSCLLSNACAFCVHL